jgi:hypothetical protein
MPRARNITLVLCFSAILVAPTVASVFRLKPMAGIDEKRKLADEPNDSPCSKGSLGRMPAIAQTWEKYFDDNFGFRKLLIGSYRLVIYYLLKTSPSPAVVVGDSDGTSRWLYYDAGTVGDGIGFDSVLGKRPYTPAELAAIAVRLKQVTQLVRGKGAKLVIAICPDKQTVYPEYLPRAKRPKLGVTSRLDQFWAMAAALGDIPLVDMRIPLKGAKPEYQLYYPSDTHWNLRGEMLGYQATARVLAAQDPSHGVLPIEELQWQSLSPRVGDLTTFMGLPALGGDRDSRPVLASIAGLAGPRRGKLLIVGDSFFASLPAVFELQFETVKRVDNAVCAVSGDMIPTGLLDAEKPDVVIIESLERYWTM